MLTGSLAFDCLSRISGKACRMLIPLERSSERWRGKLELLNSGVNGRLMITSEGGARFVVPFIDNFICWVCGNLLRPTLDGFESFKSFQASWIWKVTVTSVHYVRHRWLISVKKRFRVSGLKKYRAILNHSIFVVSNLRTRTYWSHFSGAWTRNAFFQTFSRTFCAGGVKYRIIYT